MQDDDSIEKHHIVKTDETQNFLYCSSVPGFSRDKMASKGIFSKITRRKSVSGIYLSV